MSENQTPSPAAEFDFDGWLADGERVTQTVHLWKRIDLWDEIQKLEAKLEDVPEVPEGDEPMGGAEDPNADLNAQIDALYERLDESKLSFRVVGRTSDEIDELRKETLTECREEMDKAAADGRAEAKRAAARAGVTIAKDINSLVQMGGTEWSNKVLNREMNYRIVAASTHIITPSGSFQPLTVTQVRALHKALGEQMIGRLVDAAYTAKDDMPEVTVPKS
ncbi:hypothetical protein DFO58_2208 [Arthrobacter sp. AG1021]|uniref:hypothetical protein n=1 Tax=Arthrobacter sp. AG1021 TaxID=2183908 RepID=UPI000EAE58CA|nr:hypothetical protein [Arthrobacter sp. AG1021]RKS19703.1 hypothetical protein DFO58_2208 [Arthrobacter sp. AG1021]